MDSKNEKLLDDTGWRLLSELQKNARISFTELGQRVGLTSPAVADRVRRMEEAGIISGYHTKVNLAKIGLPIMAIVRLAEIGGQSCERAAAQVSQIEEVIECIRVTGDDSMVVKVVASSVDHLTQVLDQLSKYGIPNTSIARSRPMVRSVMTSNMLMETE
ncbi:MAG: Lrp/AsnC family transcriptional regulator [Chloroflexota bacterium]